MPDHEYWSTAAQVMALMAIAIVIEARAMMARWAPGKDRALKAFLGVLWFLPLAVYGYAVPVCLRAMSGNAVWSKWPDVIYIAVAVGVGVVILAPAMEVFFRSNGWLASYATLLITFRPNVRRTEREAQRMEGEVRQFILELLQLEEDLGRSESRLDDVEQQILTGEHPACDECTSILRDVRYERARLEVVRRKAVEHRGRVLGIERTIRERPDEARRLLDEAKRELEVWIGGSTPRTRVDVS